jgi:site-specific DNA-cytosine methylase
MGEPYHETTTLIAVGDPGSDQPGGVRRDARRAGAVRGIEPAPTLTTVQRHALLTAAARDEQVPPIEDWLFRMLHTDELRRIGGFPDPDHYTLLGSQRDVSRMIGQAMSPIVIALLLSRCLLGLPDIGISLRDLVERGSPLALTAS